MTEQASRDTLEDRYWQSQWLIGELEAELRADQEFWNRFCDDE